MISFIYIINTKGPKTDPCGHTLCLIVLTICYLETICYRERGGRKRERERERERRDIKRKQIRINGRNTKICDGHTGRFVI